MSKQEEYQRGQIFYANLEPGVGAEESGLRPVLVIQNDAGNKYSRTIIVAPITSQVKRLDLPTHVQLPYVEGMADPAMVMTEHIRSIDKRRVNAYIGEVGEKEMERVDDALRSSLGLLEDAEENNDDMVLCLCPTCASQFFNSPVHVIRRIDRYQRNKDYCTYCDVRLGYDYRVSLRRKKIGEDRF